MKYEMPLWYTAVLIKQIIIIACPEDAALMLMARIDVN
jgi:hypothetical protein